MPQLLLLFQLSCASGCLPPLSCIRSYISPHNSVWSRWVLFSVISLRFFVRAIVSDDSLGFFCFLVCFTLLVAISCTNSVKVLYRVSVSSISSLLSTSGSVRGETRSTLFQSVLLPAPVFSVTEPITILGSLLRSLPNVEAVYDGHVRSYGIIPT